jgi:UDP-N-acetylmuramate--alanine ligase
MNNNGPHKINESAMPPLSGVRSVYFIGIGGIGMSALARYFHVKGISVSGYDKTETPLTKQLSEEGISIHYSENLDVIPKNADLVVYTPAVPADHKELVYYRQQTVPVVKRSDVLGAITKEGFNICIAGTHGKTTTTTMIAHILRDTGYGSNAFLGGISVNYNTNFWTSSNVTSVIEADEYDRSFLKLIPDVAIITSMDADHLDIYGDEKAMQDAFIEFGNKIKPGGLLISKFGLRRMKEIQATKKWSYSLVNDAADVFASSIKTEEGGYDFNMQLPGASVSGFKLNIGGMHNVENAIAAIAVAWSLEIDADKIKKAVASFKGVKRRFEYIIPPKKQQEGGYIYPVMIDDYAHHPAELQALLKSARSLFPQRKITVIFQPHLYSRTRDHADGFADALSIADRIVLLPIYPARELPIAGVSSEMIFDKIDRKEKFVINKEDLVRWMKERLKNIDKEFGEVIITAGAGDIDTLVEPLKEIIQQA